MLGTIHIRLLEVKQKLDDLMAMYKSAERYAIQAHNRRDQWEMYGAYHAIRRAKLELGINED